MSKPRERLGARGACEDSLALRRPARGLALALGCVLAFSLGLFARAAAPGLAYADDEAISVLFVGNSFTYNGGDKGVTQPFTSLARANGKNAKVARCTHGAGHLSDFAFPESEQDVRYRQELEDKLSSRSWDIVVLQEQSTVGIDNPAEMHEALGSLVGLVGRLQPSAELVLYMTPGVNVDEPYAINGRMRALDSSMVQLLVQNAYTQAGARFGLRVVPVGMYVQRCACLLPDEPMIAPDGWHPSAAGYFVGACAFYHAIFGEGPSKVDESANALDEALQRKLMRLASGEMSIEPGWLGLHVGERQLVSCVGAEGPVSYKSSDCKVATVSRSGRVRARSAGMAVIYAQDATGLRATCELVVSAS